jgi:glycosyltransferase involved in cell wall biosynthesis
MLSKSKLKIDIHAGNVRGIGAARFVAALLYSIEEVKSIKIANAFVHSNSQFGEKVTFEKENICTYPFGYFSRLLELIFWKYKTNLANDILVLGDLPLNTSARQFLLFHQALLFEGYKLLKPSTWKFLIFKILLRFNLKSGDVILVQSREMKDKISAFVNKDIEVIVLKTPKILFNWLNFRRISRRDSSIVSNKKVNLIYPAAPYPHKNHSLVDKVQVSDKFDIVFTCASSEINIKSSRVLCVGTLTQDQVRSYYSTSDALLFLSEAESLGIPLLEAMKCNLPIVCPRSDYTKWLDPENCFFFDLEAPQSLLIALYKLSEKLDSGWWPSWNFDKYFLDGASQNLENILLNDKYIRT